MTPEEFINEFDSLLQVHLLKPDFGNVDIKGFDEYEKSIFLTKAQEETVIEIYRGSSPLLEGFENTEETRKYLAPLVSTIVLTDKKQETGLSPKSVFFTLPEDTWFITYESVIFSDENAGCHNGEEILVTPVTQDEFYRIKENPFRGPSFRRALRLDIRNGEAEIVSEYAISGYKIRYVAKPHPIILTDLPDGLSINNETKKHGCDLNEALHRPVLERAVRMAIMSKVQK